MEANYLVSDDMANEDEGISIPAAPRPIPTAPSAAPSESEMPEAPAPTNVPKTEKVVKKERIEGEVPAAPKPEKHIERSLHTPMPGSPPLFIKVDKYNDVVENLGRLKSFSLSLRDALDALADIEKELTTGITIAHKALDEFNTIISILDSKLTKMDRLRVDSHTGPKEVDSYVRNIYNQMDRIKQELQTVSEEV